MSLKLYNSLGKEKQDFDPIDPDLVRMYTCGPTVYDYAHIGNMRSYVFADVLVRALKYLGYDVEQIMNITDVGHLSSDADSGEDKMTKGLLREGKDLTLKNMRELAEFYTERFKEDASKLNIKLPSEMYFASDYINEDVELIKKLEGRGFTYETSDGIYFDISKMTDYGILRGGVQKEEDTEARVNENSEKKNPADFALWKLNSKIGFESPWGQGFPGWHIECSALGLKFLGDQFDIHTGGIDHIPIHHTNEIAQSECATGKKPFVKYWVHNEFVDTGGEKMAKSAGNFLKVDSLVEKNIDPLAYRLWLLMAKYRTKVSFNWEALEATQVALRKLQNQYLELGEDVSEVNVDYQSKFQEYIENDLDTPRAISLLWDVFKDNTLTNADKKATILDFDKVLGLGFANLKKEYIPEEVQKLVNERSQARQNKDFQKSDELRDQIASLGWVVKDTPEGQKVSKI